MVTGVDLFPSLVSSTIWSVTSKATSEGRMRTGAYVLKSGDVLEREERELENEIFVKETQDYTFQ